MFGVFTFGRPTFGDAVIDDIPPVPPAPSTIQVLVLDCRVRNCTTLAGAQGSDFAYTLETATEPVSPVTCRVKDCEAETGVPAVSDLEIYNLQDALQYNGTPITIIPECPEGYYCPPGSLPPTITYPPGTFPVYVPPDDGTPMVLTGEGCESVITAVLGTHPTAAAIAEAVAYIQNQMAQQQARCDILNPPGGGPGPSPLPVAITLGNLTQYACLNVAYAGTIQATSTAPAPYTMLISPLPSWITPSQDPDTLFLDGTPTAVGDYSFTAYAVGVGSSGQRNYTISVVGIVTASPLPDATVDAAYAQSIDASSITGVQTWSVISGALPTWMTLNTSTGGLSGTPPEGSEGTATFTLQVTNGTVTCSKAFTIETLAAEDCLITTASPLPSGTAGTAYSETLTVIDLPGVATWSVSVGALPTGLGLDSGTGEIYGTPELPETANFTIEVTDGVVTCHKDFSLTVAAFDCAGVTDDINSLTWTYTSTDSSLGAMTMAGVGNSGSFSGGGSYSTSFSSAASAGNLTAEICNPTASPITVRITFAANWAMSADSLTDTTLTSEMTSYGTGFPDLLFESTNGITTPNNGSSNPFKDFTVAAFSTATIGFSAVAGISIGVSGGGGTVSLSGTFIVTIVP